MRRTMIVGGVVSACVMMLGGAGTAAGQDAVEAYTQRADMASVSQPGARSFDDTLLPALAEMELPPFDVSNADALRDALLLNPGVPGYEEALEWATAQPQQRALGQLAEATPSGTWWVLGLGYGEEKVPQGWREAGVMVSLGRSELLASAQFEYLDHMRALIALASIHAAEAASSGDGGRALELMRQSLVLSRSLMGRSFFEESMAGAQGISLALERARDLVYVYPDAFEAESLLEFCNALARDRFGLDRVPMPEGDRWAIEQVVEKAFTGRRETADAAELAEVFGSAGGNDRPLLQFGRVTSVRGFAGDHADAIDTVRELDGVWAQWGRMWEVLDYGELDQFAGDDPLERLDRRRFAVIDRLAPDMTDLMDLRLSIRNTLEGTRAALAVQAFRERYGMLPPKVTSVVPGMLASLERDTFNFTDHALRFEQFRYWVPVRDQPDPGPRGHRPYEVVVVPDPLADIEAVSWEALAQKAQDGTLLPPERKRIIEEVNERVLEFRASIPYALLNQIASQSRRGSGEPSYLDLDPESIDTQVITRANDQRGRNNDQNDDRSARERRRDEDRAGLTQDERDNVMVFVQEYVIEGWPLDRETFASTSQALFDWYENSEAGDVFDRNFEFDFTLMRDTLSSFDELLYGSEAWETAVQAYVRGEDPGDEVVSEIYDALDSAVNESDLVKTWAYMAQAYESEWAKWERAAGSPSLYWSDDEIGQFGTFVYEVDNRDRISDFMLWSVGPDGVDGRATVVGPGGSDDLFWPPVLSLERKRMSRSGG